MADLANADASEEDKLKAMMKQSGEDWDPSQLVEIFHIEEPLSYSLMMSLLIFFITNLQLVLYRRW